MRTSGMIGGGGLLVGIGVAGVSCAGADADSASADHWAGWIRIGLDGAIAVAMPRQEIGQGIASTYASIVADELDADWAAISVQAAPLDFAYGDQITDGSDSLRSHWMSFRRLAATARHQLIAAAAARWGVDPADCSTEAGSVVHATSGRRASYGELAGDAAGLPAPDAVTLKAPEDFSLIGRGAPRLDVPAMTDGSLKFTADIEMPGLLNAAVVHCPRVGGRVRSVDEGGVRALAGVRGIVDLGHAVAVVADSWWRAAMASQMLDIEWAEAEAPAVDGIDMWPLLEAAVRRSAAVTANVGDADAELAAARGIAVAEDYAVDYQAHAAMEPIVCVADARDGRCEVWASTQAPWSVYREAWQAGLGMYSSLAERIGRKLTGRAGARVKIHSMPVGGAFGRRLENEVVAEAVAISRRVQAPIRLIWSREDDLRNDYYRAASCHRIEAALDGQNRLLAWRDRVAGSGIIGSNSESTYDCPHYRVEVARFALGMPVGSVRSVSDTPSAFARECTIDQLASAAKVDPVQFRLQHLRGSPRLRAVLAIAASRANWGASLATGRGQGVAIHSCRGSHVAQVAEVSLNETGGIRVHRVVCAVDCGFVVNPDAVRAQIEGGIVFGLTQTLKSKISVRDGSVEQGNFDDYPLLRFDETPEIDVHLVDSMMEPGGVGEVGVPPIAPAVVNGLARSSAGRVRRLPIQML